MRRVERETPPHEDPFVPRSDSSHSHSCLEAHLRDARQKSDGKSLPARGAGGRTKEIALRDQLGVAFLREGGARDLLGDLLGAPPPQL